ncbi:hypothetical protein [Herbaspirillum frisingense]|uniref:hypothetical protein n=1 Tax=Herbaspirillum frisingense TaxID=92645 RepID=UPI0015FEDA55|nr:hypothetical protein [Herbaspirillum frisingense]
MGLGAKKVEYHFLMVDNFSTMHRIVGALLKASEFIRMKDADNGVSALKMPDENVSNIHFVLADWKIPEMSQEDSLYIVPISFSCFEGYC